MYDNVAKSPVAQQQFSQQVACLDLEAVMVEDPFEFTRHVIYGDKKSCTVVEAHTMKWKKWKSKLFSVSLLIKIVYANTASMPTTCTWHI